MEGASGRHSATPPSLPMVDWMSHLWDSGSDHAIVIWFVYLPADLDTHANRLRFPGGNHAIWLQHVVWLTILAASRSIEMTQHEHIDAIAKCTLIHINWESIHKTA
jgi:hypothetical protein